MKKILIVEDESGIANAFKKQLTMIGGFEVEIANDGQKALDLLEKSKYDVLLLDLVMPDVDGIDVLKELNTDADKYNSVPVIVLTNVTSSETREEVSQYGVRDYIVKTDIDPDKLIEKINNITN